MELRHRGPLPLPLALLALAAPIAACQFDSARLAAHACSTGGCAEGETCCGGYCVPSATCLEASVPATPPSPDLGLDPSVDRDQDGVRDDEDNCPDTANRLQRDSDRDGRGDLCDCAPSESAFAETLLQAETFATADPFVPVEQSEGWRVVGAVLEQSQPDGLQRARHGGLSDHRNLLAIAVFSASGRGESGLTFPSSVEEAALTGVVLRGRNISPGAGEGYYCALDRQNARLVIGRTLGNDLQRGEMHLFGDPALGGPGRPITTPIREHQIYTLTFRVVADQLSCRILLGDLSQVETSIEDSAIDAGGMALFTAGTSAQFSSVKVCGTH